MAQYVRTKKLTDAAYSPTTAVSEAAIRAQVDGATSEISDMLYSEDAGKGASQVGYTGGYATVEAALEAFESGGSGTLPPAGSVTNGMLVTDIKVGSLATLTTTAKTDVVSAVNEVKGLVDANGNLLIETQSSLEWLGRLW